MHGRSIFNEEAKKKEKLTVFCAIAWGDAVKEETLTAHILGVNRWEKIIFEPWWFIWQGDSREPWAIFFVISPQHIFKANTRRRSQIRRICWISPSLISWKLSALSTGKITSGKISSGKITSIFSFFRCQKWTASFFITHQKLQIQDITSSCVMQKT